MRKILSLLLTLCLFLTPMHAMAEGTCTQVQISDISLAIGDMENPITFGLSLLLTTLNGDKGTSLSLSVNNAENNTLAAGGVSVDANGLTWLISGMQTAYHLSFESLAALYSEQTGVSPDELETLFNDDLEKLLNRPVTANNEEVTNSFQMSAEHLISICNEVLSDAEQTPIGVETVSVFDAEYELQRIDFTIPAEGMQKVCLTLLDEMSALSVGPSDPFATARDELADLDRDLTMRLWYNEELGVARIESDIPTKSNVYIGGEYMMPLVGEFMNTETEGINVQFYVLAVDSVDGSTSEEGFYFSMDPSGATHSGFYIDFLDDGGDVEATFELSFGSGTYEDSNTAYIVFSCTEAPVTAFGCNYIYQDLSEDPVEQSSGYLILWCDTYDDQTEQTDSYSLSFALDIVRGSYDTDGTLSPQGITSIVEIDQMSEADTQQAQAELQGVLQNFIMGAMSDPGVQQLFILFSGMLNFVQSHNM